MKKILILPVLACLPCLHAAQESVLIRIGYAGGPGPQGDYLLVGSGNGTVSLKPIRGESDQSEVKPGDIVFVPMKKVIGR